MSPAPVRRAAPAAPPRPASGTERRTAEESTDPERRLPYRGSREPEPSGPPPIPNPVRRPSQAKPPPPVEDEPPRVKLPSPALRQRPYQRFEWRELQKVPKADVELMQQVQWLLPADPNHAVGAVAGRFKQLFELDCSLNLTHVFLARPEELRKLVPDPAFLCQLALAPHLPRGLLEVELALAHAAVDQLLGGAAGEAVVLRALTDIEEGVLGYVLLEGLKALTPSLSPDRPRLRLEGALHGVDEAVALLDPSDRLVVLQYAFQLGNSASGYFRLFLPSAAVHQARPSRESPDEQERRVRLLERNAARLKLVKDQLRVEIGHCELSALDLRGLGPGDVVLVEGLLARPDLGEGGSAKLRVGMGQRGHWRAALEVGEAGLAATLQELVRGAELPPPRELAPPSEAVEPEAAPPPEATQPFDAYDLPTARGSEQTLVEEDEYGNIRERPNVSANSAEGAELLNDIPLHVAVEIARVPVTAEEVVALRAGQVVQLGRPPSPSVELSVNGKVVAQGELVEVDGQLGVKITALVA